MCFNFSFQLEDITVPLYESSESIDKKDLETSKEERKEKVPKRKMEWEFIREFPNAELAKSSLDSKSWSRCRKDDTAQGIKIYFRCTKVKLRGPQCAAAIYHLYKNDSDLVWEYRTKSSHTHVAAEESLKKKNRDGERSRETTQVTSETETNNARIIRNGRNFTTHF